ncbi:MAG: VanZ family protein [Saprospiraceae bacterium]|nr:VanZ family protein [Saprospiraceae bacterium]
MEYFVSKKERRYWVFSSLVTVAILSTTLFIERPFQRLLVDQNVQFWIFLTGMLLTGTTIIYYALKTKRNKYEVVVWIGMAAVVLMLFFRLGAPERSHIMEFSVLAIFFHLALHERSEHRKFMIHPALLAFLLTVAIGVIDEGIQYFLPDRVYDTNDIIFNVIAAGGAVGGMLLLRWVKKIVN